MSQKLSIPAPYYWFIGEKYEEDTNMSGQKPFLLSDYFLHNDNSLKLNRINGVVTMKFI